MTRCRKLCTYCISGKVQSADYRLATILCVQCIHVVEWMVEVEWWKHKRAAHTIAECCDRIYHRDAPSYCGAVLCALK